MTKILRFDIDDAEIVAENPDSQFATAKIRAFSSGENKHDMFCDEDTLQRTASTIFDKPILYSIDKRLDDFYTHVRPEDSLIAGFVVPDSVEFERLEDGRLSLNILAKIWKRYAPKVIQFFKRDSNNKSVSVEMELYKTSEMPNGFSAMLDFAYLGITLLGDYITEASPGASMHFLSFSEENEHFRTAYNVEFGKYDEIDFEIPEIVKRNAEKGLAWYKEYGAGGTSVNLANARYLLRNQKIEPDRIKQVFKKLSSVKEFVSEEMVGSNPHHACWMLHGGNDGWNWAKGIIDQMEDINEKSISYFNNNVVTFPYSRIEDINPALKGIEPPISLAQANAIAKQADAIGSDEKKNGWAIAISQFKKTHKVVDGRWVKKEEMSMTDEEQVRDKEENFEENPEEQENDNVNMDDREEESEPEENEEEEEEMAAEYAFDFANAFSMFSEDFSEYADVQMAFSAEPKDVDYAKIAKYIYDNMCSMKAQMAQLEEDKANFAEKVSGLESFKFAKEQEEFNFAVDSTLKEIEQKTNMPSEKLMELKEKSGEFSLETLETWKNFARSVALDFAVRDQEEDHPVQIYGLPFLAPKEKVNGSPWNR